MLYIFIPKLLNNKRILIFVLSFFLIPAFFSVIRRFIVIYSFKKDNPDYTDPIMFFTMGFLIFTLENFLVMSIASIIKIMKKWYYTEHKKVILEKQNLKNELEILQYQINPHFLFNVLNNLYSLAIENNDEQTANGISKLSGLMRYNIYTGKNEKVLLKQEVDYIQNYIKLQEIRFTGDYNLNVDFEITGNIESKFIVPFIFIMFVENAFKYGISLNHESKIKISLDVNDKSIEFKVSNFKNKSGNGIDSGIGIENVKKRLEHYYKKNYQLKINEDQEIFTIFLKLSF
jgi:LytS/YehU family sensor histidine kinase